MKRPGILSAICFSTALLLLFPGRCLPAPRILKTAYKAYRVYTWQGTDILCESYQVKKGDWVYKIFKKKGHISEMDFPFFLSVFKVVNPQISNLDEIRTGQKIVIPLKRIKAREFQPNADQEVIVPILQMSHLLDKEKALSRQRQNSPDSDIAQRSPALLSLRPSQIDIIRQYAAQIDGTILDKGFFYLPGPVNEIELNLSVTPIIQLQDNARMVVLSDDTQIRKHLPFLKTGWNNISFVNIETLKQAIKQSPTTAPMPDDRQKMVDLLLRTAGFEVTHHTTRLKLNNDISIAVDARRVLRHIGPDLLIFFGNVYGNALTLLERQGFTVLSLAQENHEKNTKTIEILFKALDIPTISDPIFKNRSTRQTATIPGLFINAEKKIFITLSPLSPQVQMFFNRKQVAVFHYAAKPTTTHPFDSRKNVSAPL